MIEKISWIDANARDAKVVALVAGLIKKNEIVESGGCGCGDGSTTRHAKSGARRA
jgi:hypothetical protein